MNVLDRLDTTLRVVGGARLDGSVEVQGAKNAALPIMAAALLARGKVTLHRVPRITDVSVMWSLLEALGARLSLDGRNTITIDASNVNRHRAPYALVRKLAASFDLCGPLLGRFGRAEVPLPGGCVLGTRATDLHEQAFRALDAEVSVAHGYLIASAKGGRLSGGEIEFRMPSVGATKNAMLAAVTADGDTIVRNAAMEPEVVDLANFLNAMGARIAGQGGDTLRITGVQGAARGRVLDRCRPHRDRHADAGRRDHPRRRDREEDPSRRPGRAAVLAGRVRREGDQRRRLGARPGRAGQGRHRHRHRAAPRLPDRPAAADAGLPCTVPGVSVVEESIFNARFSYVNELVRMGADVRVATANNTALVKGVAQLSGAPVEAPDIRAGAALVIAGLCASGETEIIGLEYIDRGYERLEETLSALGGQVQRSSGIIPFSEPTGTFETSEYPKVPG